MNSDQTFLDILLTHQDISAYLSAYALQERPQVLLITLLYGIYSLRSLHPRTLTLEKLVRKTRRASALFSAESLIPNVKAQLNQIRTEINQFENQCKPAKRVTWTPEKSNLVDFWNQTGPEDKNFASSAAYTHKSYTGWVGDFSEMVKRSPASYSKAAATSKQLEVYKPPSHPIHEPTLKSSLMDNLPYSSALSSRNRPAEEAKHSDRMDFNRLLESAGSPSLDSGRNASIATPWLHTTTSDEN